MRYKDYYAVMGLERDATADEVKRAYRKLARKFHPDVSKQPDAEERFKELGEAYEVLKDPEKRAAYDELGANWQAEQDFRPPPNWDEGFEFSGRGVHEKGFSDFFEQLFGQAARAQPSSDSPGSAGAAFYSPGRDHHAKILIQVEDAYLGATRTISLRSPTVNADGHVVTQTRSLNVRIPKGIRAGQQIRLTGQGAPGMGGVAGDLYLEVNFDEHPLYRVDGKDVFLTLPVAPWEAALGASVQVPTPTGAVSLKVPAGTSGGRKLCLKKRGIPAVEPGDFYVVVEIALPPADTDAARHAYELMRDELDFDPRKQFGG